MPPNQISQLPSDPAAINLTTLTQANSHHLAYANVHNGRCQLLYAPLQLHLHRRKTTQLHLLALEEQAIYRSFNERFCSLRKVKDKCLGKIEEQLARISSIQTELGLSRLPADIAAVPEEDESSWIRVDAHEVKALQWLPAAERCDIIICHSALS